MLPQAGRSSTSFTSAVESLLVASFLLAAAIGLLRPISSGVDVGFASGEAAWVAYFADMFVLQGCLFPNRRDIDYDVI